MRRCLFVLFGAATLLLDSTTVPRAQDVPRGPLYSVGYLDIAPSSERAAIETLERYRDAIAKDDGFVRFDLLEQMGRPGRFILLEAWRDQQALDARAMSVQTIQLLRALKPLSVGAYDQRPYHPLSIAPASAVVPASAVYGVMHVDTTPTPTSNAVMLLQQLAEVGRKEDGNLRFDVVQHLTRTNHFTVIELWRDRRSADAHALAANTKKFRDDLLPILGSPYDDRFYKAVE
jgi:quinol monooxygenase YgiN